MDYIEQMAAIKEEFLNGIEEIADKEYPNRVIEVYKDYRDEIPEETIRAAVEADASVDYLEDSFQDDATEVWYSYYRDDAINTLKKEMPAELRQMYETYELEDDLTDWCDENLQCVYNMDEWNKDICVDLMLDVGESDHEFIDNNVLYVDDPVLDEHHSSLYWLAKQQGRETEYKEMVKELKDQENLKPEERHFSDFGPFVNSVRNELLECVDYPVRVTLLVKMPVMDYLKLADELKKPSAKQCNVESLTVSKDATVGLYEPFSGFGALFEIKLEKDVEIPRDKLFDACYEASRGRNYSSPIHGNNWSIHEVFGPVEHLWWTGSVKVNEKTPERVLRTGIKEPYSDETVQRYVKDFNDQFKDCNAIFAYENAGGEPSYGVLDKENNLCMMHKQGDVFAYLGKQTEKEALKIVKRWGLKDSPVVRITFDQCAKNIEAAMKEEYVETYNYENTKFIYDSRSANVRMMREADGEEYEVECGGFQKENWENPEVRDEYLSEWIAEREYVDQLLMKAAMEEFGLEAKVAKAAEKQKQEQTGKTETEKTKRVERG